MIDYQIEPNEGLSPAMRHSPRLLVACPTAVVVIEGARLAVGHGLDWESETRLRRAIRHPEPSPLLGELVASQEEATVVLADNPAAGGPIVEAWRGATSNFEAYIVENGPDRPPSVADHFRDAVALVSLARRTLDRTALADHLLFANVPCARTYLTKIGRLGHGERYKWQSG
jgi:hypothetical protein